MTKNILSIAGSDPSGGAGIQADLKAIAATGGYGMAVITALTAQNTRGVDGVQSVDPQFITAQLQSIANDVRIDAVKIGMLANAGIIRAVALWLAEQPAGLPVVLDPVMIATSGDRLLDDAAQQAIEALLGQASVITPNMDELAVLLGEKRAGSWDSVLDQASRLAARHDVLVVAKGGHLGGDTCPDALVGPDGVLADYPGLRIETPNTHGTGCTLSSALASFHARTGEWPQALKAAKDYLAHAICASGTLEVGGGHGPVSHFDALWNAQGIPPAHDAMAGWWDAIKTIRTGIDELSFIRQLADGTLDRDDFGYYINQDALYLRGYAQVLARASIIAPDAASQRFWAAAASATFEEEMVLHREYAVDSTALSSDTTANYVNHLASCSDDYAELIAAILPCYWIYQDVGTRLAAANHPGHPYRDWLATYSSPEFDAATTAAIGMVREAYRTASDATRLRMWRAFESSSRHELLFFAQSAARA
ncbi:bifunctional hydroxymethylpyrimidine kinase/phosphomethylpyrimidine kinase [Glutamicibacter sp. MNS18]|uniref:bifunctional hydroxymethylpyrimidine kinase/phosphomethylpyrimidine kinase n=1 Tax=Glutamicibacter sp. MNS18 TaxID=2989817 RepID=UPI002236B3BE|nr:bifunctional hydroxymethylpyrimidine kinase/phosphomethylpyrimidine kinase [Glutamicibacter sp. MNS18]MCW4466691.1 bifunctional hydroxymethylpyrimidine kinase/phosphomethylpyrimidine kinase [Glutamicibacter sp. MNS18]